MGALTLKSFPFELRGWDIEKLESIDPTDGFATNTRIYINKNQIIQIEPDYDIHFIETWLSDKGRQFFDGIFGTYNTKQSKNLNKLTNKGWSKIIKNIVQVLYMFNHCSTQKNNNSFFTIIFENLSLEMLSLLTILDQKQSVLKLRRIENIKTHNNLEINFQLNESSNKIKLNSSTLCLLVSTNPRYEGYRLNLNLRQRFLKGDFKCLIVGSLTELTFPTSSLGSNLNILKTIVEGNNLTCQNFKYAKNPTLIINTELLKKNNSKSIFKTLKYINLFNNSWNGLNILNSSLHETGTYSLNQFIPLQYKDLNNFSVLYFLNITNNNLPNLKNIIALKLFNQTKLDHNINSIFLNQNSKIDNSITTIYKKLTNTNYNNYYNLPSNMFYENEETFINTEGFVKRTNKLILKKKIKNNWQILRRIFNYLQINLQFLNNKQNNIISFNCEKINNFKKYIHFQYQTTQILTHLNFYLVIKNENFKLLNKNSLKKELFKIKNTKLKYWLDDFFNGGKDEYSQYSLILSNCSKLLRTKSTNFF